MADENAKLEPLVIPEDLSALSDEELDGLLAECAERAEALNDDKTIAALPVDEAVALIENAVATGEALDAEAEKRAEAKAEQEQILADTRARLAKRLAGDEDDAEEPAAEDDADEPEAVVVEPDAEPEPEPEPAKDEKAKEPILAAAKPRATLRRSREHEPRDSKPRQAPKLMALADYPGRFSAGEMIDLDTAAQLVSDRWNKTHRVDGPKQDVPLLRFNIDTPPDRMLVDDDPIGNMLKIQNVVGPEALVASGGICVPPEPYYDFQLLSGEQTPVVDSIPRFGAGVARGGIAWMTPATMASITGGVGEITHTADALGGTNATKDCSTIDCPELNTAYIDAIYHCLTVGNMNQRTAPELVRHWVSLMMAVHARVRETKALDFLTTMSTPVTQAAFGGFANTLLGGVLQAAEAMRNRHRMQDNAVLRAWFPLWTLGAMAEDLIRQQFGRFDVLSGSYKSQVTAYLRSCQIEPTFYIDSATAGAQAFGAQAPGVLQTFPAECKWFLAPEGTFVRLDGGSLDFGIVRDSVLNATNDFQMFGEVFENYAMIGIESLAITTDVCPNGEVTLPVAQPCGSGPT